MKKIHYSWLVCLGCAMILFCTSGLTINAFTIYQPYILNNGLTNTQSSFVITVRSLFCFLSMFLTAPYYRRLSLRNGLCLASCLTVLGFFLFGLARGFYAYCVSAAVIGLSYGLGTLIPIAMLIERWFYSKRSLAFGICTAMTGLSTLGIPSLLISIIERFSLRTAFIAEAAFVALFTLIGFLIIRSEPQELGLLPYGLQKEEESRPAPSGRGLQQRDWLLLVPMLLLIGAMTNVGYSHLSVLLAGNGFPVRLVALAITVSGVMMTCGKFTYGLLSEKISVYRTNYVFGVIVLSGLILLCLMGTNTKLMFAGSFLYGLGLALTTVGLTTWAGEWSRPEQFDRNVRRFQIGYTAGGLVFSALPGILADRSGGSYVPAYVFFILCTVYVLFACQFTFIRLRGKGGPRKSFPGRRRKWASLH